MCMFSIRAARGFHRRSIFGTRISRFSMDLKEFADHLGVKSADYCGWSMGAAVLWGYIDLFGTKGIRKAGETASENSKTLESDSRVYSQESFESSKLH